VTYPDRPVFTGPVYGAPVGPPARPGIVSAAFFAALASGLFSVIGGILEFSGARELAEKVASDALGTDITGLDLGVTDAAVTGAVNTLQFRGILAIVLGALVMAASLTVHNAALWGRIVTGVLLLVSLCANGLEFTDVASGATTALGVTANLLGIAAIVMSFLPATNRYAAARKARTAQPLRT
jgi:hypothetical protein